MLALSSGAALPSGQFTLVGARSIISEDLPIPFEEFGERRKGGLCRSKAQRGEFQWHPAGLQFCEEQRSRDEITDKMVKTLHLSDNLPSVVSR